MNTSHSTTRPAIRYSWLVLALLIGGGMALAGMLTIAHYPLPKPPAEITVPR